MKLVWSIKLQVIYLLHFTIAKAFFLLFFFSLFYMMNVSEKQYEISFMDAHHFEGKKDYPLQNSLRKCLLFLPFILVSHIFMNVSNLFLCLGNEIGFKFVCHKYGMYSLIFSCGESFLCYRVTSTAAVVKMFVRFSLLCCLPVLKHLLF